MLYKLVVFLHVVSVFGYLLSHGVSVSMAFALKGERDIQKIKSLLTLSGASYPMMFRLLYASVIFGIIAGFQGHWWKFGWIWTSLVLLILIIGLMGFLGGRIYGGSRRAAGLPYFFRGKTFPAEPPVSNEELYALLSQGNPVLLTVIGYGGYALIAWLMMAKPF